MSHYSRSQIDRLGTRLRDALRPSDEDSSLYFDWSQGYSEALGAVESGLKARVERIKKTAAFVLSSRIKQTSSVAAKLRRMHTKLSALEDIAGHRVVVPLPEDLDRLLVECLTLRVSRSRDYRNQPRGGYRAVHLTIRVDGKPVELQLRTVLQDAWANLCERCAAKIHPELKYDGGPGGWRRALDYCSLLVRCVEAAQRRVFNYGECVEAEAAMREINADVAATPIRLAPAADGSLQRALEQFVHLCNDSLPSAGGRAEMAAAPFSQPENLIGERDS